MNPSEMASLSNSRWEQSNRTTNNGDVAETAEHDVNVRVIGLFKANLPPLIFQKKCIIKNGEKNV